MTEVTAILDLDWCKYTAAAVGEKRSIVAIHNITGDEYKFDTRTAMWGRKKTRDGGWLEEQNKKRTTPLLHSDFTIKDVQTPEPIENCLYTAKTMVEGALFQLGTTKYKGFVGKGESFRVGRSTVF